MVNVVHLRQRCVTRNTSIFVIVSLTLNESLFTSHSLSVYTILPILYSWIMSNFTLNSSWNTPKFHRFLHCIDSWVQLSGKIFYSILFSSYICMKVIELCVFKEILLLKVLWTLRISKDTALSECSYLHEGCFTHS